MIVECMTLRICFQASGFVHLCLGDGRLNELQMSEDDD